jgi:hypothetical protein
MHPTTRLKRTSEHSLTLVGSWRPPTGVTCGTWRLPLWASAVPGADAYVLGVRNVPCDHENNGEHGYRVVGGGRAVWTATAAPRHVPTRRTTRSVPAGPAHSVTSGVETVPHAAECGLPDWWEPPPPAQPGGAAATDACRLVIDGTYAPNTAQPLTSLAFRRPRTVWCGDYPPSATRPVPGTFSRSRQLEAWTRERGRSEQR